LVANTFPKYLMGLVKHMALTLALALVPFGPRLSLPLGSFPAVALGSSFVDVPVSIALACLPEIRVWAVPRKMWLATAMAFQNWSALSNQIYTPFRAFLASAFALGTHHLSSVKLFKADNL